MSIPDPPTVQPTDLQGCTDLVTAALTSFMLPLLSLGAVVVLCLALMFWPRRKHMDVHCIITRTAYGEILGVEFLPEAVGMRMLKEDQEGRNQP